VTVVYQSIKDVKDMTLLRVRRVERDQTLIAGTETALPNETTSKLRSKHPDAVNHPVAVLLKARSKKRR